jgi:hypothetical protein
VSNDQRLARHDDLLAQPVMHAIIVVTLVPVKADLGRRERKGRLIEREAELACISAR